MSVLKINNNNFGEIIKSDKRILIDFYADWCNPCRMTSPFIEQIAEENPQYITAKVNIDEEPAIASQFGVTSIPTFVVIENGKIIAQSSGARPKNQILELLES